MGPSSQHSKAPWSRCPGCLAHTPTPPASALGSGELCPAYRGNGSREERMVLLQRNTAAALEGMLCWVLELPGAGREDETFEYLQYGLCRGFGSSSSRHTWSLWVLGQGAAFQQPEQPKPSQPSCPGGSAEARAAVLPSEPHSSSRATRQLSALPSSVPRARNKTDPAAGCAGETEGF